MTKSTITRERLQEIAEDGFLKQGESKELARIALAAMDSEPVAWQYRVSAGPATGWSLWHDGKGEQYENSYKVERRPLYLHAQPSPERNQVRREHAEWSQATFGNVGPVGPLKHLSKEALEAAAEPGDLSEWADMQFLLWDAQRRASITDEQITQAMIDKLAVNKQRSWPEPKDGEPRLHINEQPAPVVPNEMTAGIAVKHWEGGRGSIESFVAGYNFCRATMLQASPVCTCPSGDGSLRWPCQVHPGSSPANPGCWCRTCRPMVLNDMRFVVCPDCGNKRCPRANDHRNACTGSNEPGQEGSARPDTPQSPGSEPATVPGKWIPVSERMPENDGAYLCWDNRYVTTYAFMFGAWQANQFVAKNITHWMPLPAAPQEVKSE